MTKGGIPLGLVANVLDYDIVLSEFKPLSLYYAHFLTYTIEKDMNLPYLLGYGFNSKNALLLEG